MKSITWFQIGAGIDLIGLAMALYFVVGDLFNRSGGTNNPTMYRAILLYVAWIALGFLFKWLQKMTLALIVLWIPAVALLGYALMALMFIIFKPKF